jgi:hypothetical protein
MKTPLRLVPLGVWSRDSYEKANVIDADGKKIIFDDAAVLRTVIKAVNEHEALVKSHASLQLNLRFMIRNWHREHEHKGETSSDLTMAEYALKESEQICKG